MQAKVLPRVLLIGVGLVSLVPYLYALQLQDLRQHTVEFEYAFFAAFGLYVAATLLVLRNPTTPPLRVASPPSVRTDDIVGNESPSPLPSLRGGAGGGVPANNAARQCIRASARGEVAVIFAFAVLFRAVLVFTPPTLSDDMYRYVWDGRVQAQHISPYANAPDDPRLANLRDDAIYPRINRPGAVTVYPAGAELAYAAIWRIVPDDVRWFQIVMAGGDLLAGVLLLRLLRALHRPERLVLIYLWSPLVVFETAHAAHIDGLVVPLLVGAWLARVKGRDGWVGALLGVAASLKLYPALLLPAMWRWRDDQGRLRPAWQMPLSFAAAFALPYLPYLVQGSGVVGFLPEYFDERFNMGLAGVITHYLEQPPNPLFYKIAEISGGNFQHVINALLLASLVLTGLALVLRAARGVSGEQAVRRSIWMIGAFTLFTQNLFPWYMLWLVPLIALFLQPGRLGLKLNAWTSWFLFSGLVTLAYTFFIGWKAVAWVPWVEFGPLYALLLIPAAWKAVEQVNKRKPHLRNGRISILSGET